jgi:hypothetical protein
MDEIVKAALRKWPHVPHCHGWLALDARGHWYMRDDRIQAAGPFPQVKGSRIDARKAARIHPPQLRPRRRRRLVLPERPAAGVRGAGSRALGVARGRCTGLAGQLHTGLAATVQSAWLDESGRLFLTPTSVSAWCTAWTWAWPPRRWTPASGSRRTGFAQMPARFGYQVAFGAARRLMGARPRGRLSVGGAGLAPAAALVVAAAGAAGALGSASLPPAWLAM